MKMESSVLNEYLYCLSDYYFMIKFKGLIYLKEINNNWILYEAFQL